MKAMVLAAGEGTRLRPLTLSLPKPMIPVGHVPLLARTLSQLRDQGIVDIAVNLHHRPEVIRAALGDGSALGVRLHYSEEPALQGTAGGVKGMEGFLDETFLVLYGDNLYRFDLAPIVDFHRRNRALATIATFTAENPSACGLVETDAAGRVIRFREKPPPEEIFTDQANAGVYVLEPEILGRIPSETACDFGRDIFPALLAAAPGSIFARPLGGYLRDTGTFGGYRQANWDTLAWGETPTVAATATLAPDARLSGRNLIGSGCRIGSGAQLSESILWENVTVGAGAHVVDSILGHGATVAADARIEGAVVAPGETVR